MKRVLAIGTLFTAASFAESSVTYIEAPRVDQVFEKGGVLLNAGGYQVHASRRDAPGKVEVHTLDTDVIHVLAGSATFVTGGKLIGAENAAANEMRGSAIEGGTSRVIRPGDVIVVPNGTPHWFQKIDGPLKYFVVKVRACEGAK